MRFAKCTGSSLDANGMVQLTVVGVGDLDPLNPGAAVNDDTAERAEDQPAFGALGVLARPLPDDASGYMEVVCVRTADGMAPIAMRDRRLSMGTAAPGAGVVGLVGYGGGFHSMTPVADGSAPAGGGTLHVLYCPYDFDANGVAQKAHAIIMDPTPGNESLQVIHGDGMAVLMSGTGKKALVLKNAAGNATMRLDDDGFQVNADKIVLAGVVYLGFQPQLALPLLAGPASPPGPSVYISPT